MKKSIGLLILRIGTAALMLPHGWTKLSRLIETGEMNFPDPLGIGGGTTLIFTIFAEFICALLIIIGFKTRWATIPLILTMLGAALVFHVADPWSDKELALIYAVAFSSLAFLGGGEYALDHILKRKDN